MVAIASIGVSRAGSEFAESLLDAQRGSPQCVHGNWRISRDGILHHTYLRCSLRVTVG